jgi:hypothetical protein
VAASLELKQFWSAHMSSNERLKNVLMGTRTGVARRKIRSLLGRAVRSTIDSLEGRRLLANPVADAGGPYTVNEGSTITIDGGNSTDDGSIATYAWDLNYKVSKGFRRGVTGQAFSYEAGDSAAPRTIALRVTDDNGNTDLVTTTLTVDDVDPTVTLVGDSTAEEGAPYALAWSSTDPGNDTITGYSIDWGDSVTTTHGAGVSSTTHVYDTDDSYTITFTATDEDGTHVTTKNVTVNDVAPVINASLVHSTINEGEQARVNFSSPNRAGSIDQWIIDWGDDSVSVRPGDKTFAQHVFADNGVYTVTVTALEDDGTATDQTVTLTVTNVAPTFTLGGIPDESPEGDPITATHTAPGDVGVNDTFSYAWELKKGSNVVATSATTGSYTFTPTDNGTYTLKLTVSDNDGESSVQSKTFTVTNVAPGGNVSATVPSPFYEGTTVQFTANVTDAGSADTHTYNWRVEKSGNPWTLPDGLGHTSATFDFTPTDEGSYVVGCVITDDDTAQYIASSSTLTVVNADPTAGVTGGPAVVVPGTVALLPTGSGGRVNPSYADDHNYIEAGNSVFGRVHAVYKWQLPAGLTSSADVTGASFSFGYSGTFGTPYDVDLVAFDSASATVVTGDLTDIDNASDVIATDVFAGDTLNNVTISNAALEDAIKDALDAGRSYVSLALRAINPVGPTGGYEMYQMSDGGNAPSLTITSNTPVPHANEGATQTFNANAADAGEEDTLHYAWTVTKNTNPYTLANGVVTNAATFAFAPNDNGTYEVSVTVTDGDGGTVSSSSNTFIVDNVAPTATLTAPTTGTEGSSLSFSIVKNDAGSADTHTYAWTVEKGGNPYVVGTPTNMETFAFTPDDNGSYVVSVVITDDDGGAVTKTSSAIIVANAAPTATIGAAPVGAHEGDTISLTSTHADAGVNDSIAYLWTVAKDSAPYTLAPGTIDNTSTFDFVATDNGTYVVTLAVTDGTGSSSTTRTVTVANSAPVGTITGQPVGSVDEGTTLNLAVTVADAGIDDTFTYEWRVELNGQAVTLPNGLDNTSDTFDYVTRDDGTYVISCVVADNDEGQHIAGSGDIIVDNVAPTGSISGTPLTNVNEGAQRSFTANPVDAGAADTFTYAWSVAKDNGAFTLPGGTSTTSQTFAFTPTDNGDYVVSVVITDDNLDAVTVHSTTFTVDNVAPTAAVSGPTTGSEGTSLTFTSTKNDAGSADTHTYAWTVTKDAAPYALAGGVSTTGSSLTFTPDDEGVYIASVVVTDDELDAVTAHGASTTVANVAPNATITGGPSGLIAENTSVTYGTSVTDAGVNDTKAYAWSVTRNNVAYDLTGVTTNAAGLTFTPNDNGAYVLTVTVTDGDGGSKTVTKNITVLNVNPLATVTTQPLGPVAQGDDATYIVEAQDQSPVDVLSYAWQVTRSGVPYVLPNNVATDDATFTFAPTQTGTYAVTVTVTDNDGGSTGVIKSLTVTNVAPTINSITEANGENGTVAKHTALEYSADVVDPGSESLTYSWVAYRDLEVFATDNAETFDFTPTLSGEYYVQLTVSDGTASDSITSDLITVNNSAPIISTMTRGTAVEGVTMTYSAEVSDPNLGDELTYLWELKKGSTTVATATTPNFSAVPANDGSYSMTLTLDDGETTTSQTQNFSVANVAPVGSIANIVGTPIEGSPVNLVASATDVPADTLTYTWTVSHGETVYNGTGSTFSFTPTDDGAYISQVVISDGTTTTTVSKSFTVGNNIPTGELTMPTFNGVNGWDSQFSVEDVSHYIGDAVTVDWNWGDGQTTLGQAISATQSHRWTNTGTYTVKATFKDDDGGSSFVTHSFTVNDYGLQADPMGDGVALVVNGTGANDTITFEKTGAGKIKAIRNGVSLGATFNPTRIIANAEGGVNSIVANSNVIVPVVFYGGSGKDTLTGGSGNDVLVGKKGIDVLNGGNGRDFLIGGADSDFLYGAQGDEILVGDGHASAENFSQLGAIMTEWGNTSRTFTQRTTRLRNGAEGLAALFASGTIIGDSRVDVIAGGANSDWMFKDIGSVTDVVTGVGAGDRVENVAA